MAQMNIADFVAKYGRDGVIHVDEDSDGRLTIITSEELMALQGEADERLGRLENVHIPRLDREIAGLASRVDAIEMRAARTAGDIGSERREQESETVGRHERLLALIRASNEEARRRREAIQTNAERSGEGEPPAKPNATATVVKPPKDAGKEPFKRRAGFWF